MDTLKDGTDQQSTMLLAAIRIGISVQRATEALRSADPLASLAQATSELSATSPNPGAVPAGASSASSGIESFKALDMGPEAHPWIDLSSDDSIDAMSIATTAPSSG